MPTTPIQCVPPWHKLAFASKCLPLRLSLEGALRLLEPFLKVSGRLHSPRYPVAMDWWARGMKVQLRGGTSEFLFRTWRKLPLARFCLSHTVVWQSTPLFCFPQLLSVSPDLGALSLKSLACLHFRPPSGKLFKPGYVKTSSMPSHCPGGRVAVLPSKCRLLQNTSYFQPEASLTCSACAPPSWCSSWGLL